jgi:hypothetical protein
MIGRNETNTDTVTSAYSPKRGRNCICLILVPQGKDVDQAHGKDN